MIGESPGESVVYREEQRFRQIWILFLVGFIAKSLFELNSNENS
jgi:hypothetical protein